MEYKYQLISASGYTFIGGGCNNNIATAGTTFCCLPYSFIGCGSDNNILTASGAGANDTCYNSIVGGRSNTISEITCFSSILGGFGNTVSGYYSAILGGFGNTVTHNYAAAFGNGISSVYPDTFHVSCLNAINTPPTPGSWLPGTIIRHVPGTALPSCAQQLFIIA